MALEWVAPRAVVLQNYREIRAGDQGRIMRQNSPPPSDYVKVVVLFERREDGGLRAYSDDVPGFVLSHSDPASVLADVKPALEGILSHMYGEKVIVEELPRLRETLTQAGVIEREPTEREYVTHRAVA
jgi:hypothetical protein